MHEWNNPLQSSSHFDPVAHIWQSITVIITFWSSGTHMTIIPRNEIHKKWKQLSVRLTQNGKVFSGFHGNGRVRGDNGTFSSPDVEAMLNAKLIALYSYDADTSTVGERERVKLVLQHGYFWRRYKLRSIVPRFACQLFVCSLEVTHELKIMETDRYGFKISYFFNNTNLPEALLTLGKNCELGTF